MVIGGSARAPELIDADELTMQARESVWVSRVRRLVRYVGDGRVLTSKGNLKLADGKELVELLGTQDPVDTEIGDRVFKTRSSTQLRDVDLTFHIALATGLLDVDGGRVVPGPNAAILRGSLPVWYAVFSALAETVRITELRYGDDAYNWWWFAEHLDDCLPEILMALGATVGVVPMEQLLNDFWDDVLDVYELDGVPQEKLDFARGLAGGCLHEAMCRLAEHGAVVMDEAARAKLTNTDAAGTVGSTLLGRWAVQRARA